MRSRADSSGVSPVRLREVAVAAFLAGTIRFDQIHSVNARTIEVVRPEAGESASLDGLLALDERARHHARQTVKGLAP